jgi:hypothetical protein
LGKPREKDSPTEEDKTALFKQVLMDLFPEIIGEADYVLTQENLEILLEEFENRLDAL